MSFEQHLKEIVVYIFIADKPTNGVDYLEGLRKLLLMFLVFFFPFYGMSII